MTPTGSAAKNPMLLLALGGFGLLLFAGGSRKASAATLPQQPGGSAPPQQPPGRTPGVIPPIPPPPGGGKVTASKWQDRIIAALSRGSASELLTIADEMAAAGLNDEANALRRSAEALQSIGSLGSIPGLGSAGSKSPGQPPQVTPSPAIPNPPNSVPPSVVLPPVVLPPVAPSPYPIPPGVPLTDQRAILAQQVASDLNNTSRYQENQSLVKLFQAQEGLTKDGKYGPKTALKLLNYGIVPPRPRYWHSKTMKTDKASYSAALLKRAREVPSQAADLTLAANVQSDPAS